MDVLSFFLCSIPFWIPAAIGLYLVTNAPNDFRQMAGLFTLKPILTTPFWFLIVWFGIFAPNQNENLGIVHFASILPGAVVTAWIVAEFWHLFSGPNAGSAKALLALDCIRWLNSFLMILPFGEIGAGLTCFFAIIGLAMPSVFAAVALSHTISQTLVE